MAAITLIISGVAYIVMGNCPNLAVYTIAYTCLIGSIMSAGYVAGGALVAQWFPKRKGVVMGYTTMGLNNRIRNLGSDDDTHHCKNGI